MEASVTKVARVSTRFSKSLARRRFRPNQEKVHSTTQRRGRTTKPLALSLRLIWNPQQRAISRRSAMTEPEKWLVSATLALVALLLCVPGAAGEPNSADGHRPVRSLLEMRREGVMIQK